VHGPNGFYRQFAGDGPGITATPAGQDLRLTITCTSPAMTRLAVSGAHAGLPAQVAVPAGETVTVTIPARRRGGWYDVSVTADAIPRYLRHLSGHVETGAPSASDPALSS
jgi:phospholipase C